VCVGCTETATHAADSPAGQRRLYWALNESSLQGYPALRSFLKISGGEDDIHKSSRIAAPRCSGAPLSQDCPYDYFWDKASLRFMTCSSAPTHQPPILDFTPITRAPLPAVLLLASPLLIQNPTRQPTPAIPASAEPLLLPLLDRPLPDRPEPSRRARS
jgi:hypothetical protein